MNNLKTNTKTGVAPTQVGSGFGLDAALGAAPSVINGVVQIGGMYYDALNRQYDQEFRDMAAGMNSYTNIGDLSSQEFAEEGFQFGDIFRGIGAGVGAGAAVGAAVGSIAPGVGTAIGAGVGALAGTGSAVIKRVKEMRARDRFNDQRREGIQGAINRNSMIDRRRRQAQNNIAQLRNLYNDFY